MTQQSRLFLPLTIGISICLLLLINVSFKVVEIQGYVFSTSAILCPIIAALYLLVLKNCTFQEQRYILNFSLVALYIFSLGLYFLVHLPAAENMHNNPVYHIVFKDIPKKFFAVTVSFALSICLPHWIYRIKSNCMQFSIRQILILGTLGGLLFFTLDFYLLFMHLSMNAWQSEIFITSLGVCSVLLLIFTMLYLIYSFCSRKKTISIPQQPFPLYECMISCAVVIMLVCLVCEYRLVMFGDGWTVAASGLFFPGVVMIGTLIGELYGYRASLRFTLVLVITELVFDGLLMGLIMLPAPAFFDFNPYYNHIMARRLPAASLALLITFLTNSILLEYLRRPPFSMQRSIRIVIANVCATSLLCIINYTLLFSGVYEYDQIVNLALNAWVCKIATMLIGLPLLMKFSFARTPAFK